MSRELMTHTRESTNTDYLLYTELAKFLYTGSIESK